MAQVNLPDLPANLFAYTVTIKSGASESEAIDTQGMNLVGIIMPAAWDAANLSIKVGLPGSTLQQVTDNTGKVPNITAAASKPIALPLDNAAFFPVLSILSVSAADGTTPVNQNADRILTLLFKRYLS